MIFVCEPSVTKFSHEKVNSGFLHALTLAYPNETIRFYAQNSHIQAMKSISELDGTDFSKINFVPITFGNPEGFAQFFRYHFLFTRILKEALLQNSPRVFFLSYNPFILYQLKRLKMKSCFANFIFTFVLHGSFEHLATEQEAPIPLIPIPVEHKGLRERLRGKSIAFIAQKIFAALFEKLQQRIPNPWTLFSQKYLSEKKVFYLKQNQDFRFVALSPHVIKNARRYMNVEKANLFPAVLPTVFRNFPHHISSDYIRFAVFGYGNSTMLHNVLLKLAQKKITKAYEIRIISMDNRGTQGFPNVTCTSPGKAMDRREMERYVPDVDLFLILYDSSRYRLSCSGSILESLSYRKPILHFENECLDFFNHKEEPIGYRAKSIDEYADKMLDLIENFNDHKVELENFGRNIDQLRERYAISNSVPSIKKAFELKKV